MTLVLIHFKKWFVISPKFAILVISILCTMYMASWIILIENTNFAFHTTYIQLEMRVFLLLLVKWLKGSQQLAALDELGV